MKNIVVITKNKALRKTFFRPTHKEENRVDDILFLISPEFIDGDITAYDIILQVVIPEPDEYGHPVTSKMRKMELDKELYKGHYSMTLPISAILTKVVGEIVLSFLFFDTTDPDHVKIIKTTSMTIDVTEAAKFDGAEFDDDESYNILVTMQKEINELKGDKIDNQIEYDATQQTLQFYSDGKPIGEAISLDQEVNVDNW